MNGHIAPLLLLLTAAPVWMVERAKRCARPPTIEDAHPIAQQPVPGTRWTDRHQCRFERMVVTDAGVSIIERGHVTEPERTAKGWQLGECVTFRHVESPASTVQTSFRCSPHRRLTEGETHADGTTVSRRFNSATGALEEVITDRRLFDGEHAIRCEQFPPDGGAPVVTEYASPTRRGCAPLGWPPGAQQNDGPGYVH